MDKNRKSTGPSVPYGQACLHCFKSKCKCVSRPSGNDCERCHRLNKQCRSSDLIRKRNAQKTQNSSERIAQLEQKLEGLVSVLQSVAASPDSTAALQTVLDEKGLASQRQQSASAEPLTTTPTSSSGICSASTPTAVNGGSEQASAIGGAALSSPTSSRNPAIDYPSNACSFSCEPLADEAEAYLAVFRTLMLPSFAFIHLPSDMMAQQLRQERPFLFRAIVAVASPSTQDKLARGRELKSVLAQTAILENQSNTDLLLGLLTYVAWGNDQFLNRSGTLSRLMLMAMSLVYDLRLDKPLPQNVYMVAPFLPAFRDCCRSASGEIDHRLLLEEQRAVLGCFLLSSVKSLISVSSYFAAIEPLRWTPRLEECLRSVSANKECLTDEAFAFQVRLQLLAQRAVLVKEQQEVDYIYTTTAEPAPPLPSFYFKTLQRQLQELRRSMPPTLEPQGILIATTYYIELCINETAHTANAGAPSTLVAGSSMPGFERLECLWRSVTAIKSWINVFLTLSSPACVSCSFLIWAQMSRCVITLYRLSVYPDPAWDRQAVRNNVDLLLVLEQMAVKLELASHEAGQGSSNDFFQQIPRMMRIFRGWASTKMQPVYSEEESAWQYSKDSMADQDQMMALQSINFENDAWIEDIFGYF